MRYRNKQIHFSVRFLLSLSTKLKKLVQVLLFPRWQVYVFKPIKNNKKMCYNILITITWAHTINFLGRSTLKVGQAMLGTYAHFARPRKPSPGHSAERTETEEKYQAIIFNKLKSDYETMTE